VAFAGPEHNECFGVCARAEQPRDGGRAPRGGPQRWRLRPVVVLDGVGVGTMLSGSSNSERGEPARESWSRSSSRGRSRRASRGSDAAGHEGIEEGAMRVFVTPCRVVVGRCRCTICGCSWRTRSRSAGRCCIEQRRAFAIVNSRRRVASVVAWLLTRMKRAAPQALVVARDGDALRCGASARPDAALARQGAGVSANSTVACSTV
jgi:hypothetical protein